MATNSDLERAIIDNPNDLDGYLVYGDWLQAEGDPRGELIALQSAQLRAEATARSKSIDKLMSKHADLLLGDLKRYSEKELRLDWHLGFIESARIEIASEPVAQAALAMLVRHPSGRFIRSLSIAPATKGKKIDAQAYVQILLDEKQPKTLTDLHIGAPGTWDIDAKGGRGPELVKVFPRLLKSLAAVWSAIMQEVADQKRMDPKYDPTEQPDLIPLRNIDLDGKVDKALVLKGLKMEIDKGKDLGIVNAMRRAFTVDSLDRFAVALGEQFTKLGETTALRWGFEAMGKLGHDLAAEWIGTRLRTWSHQRSVQGAELLGQIGSGVAIYELYGLIADPSAYRPRRDQGLGQLEVAAQRAKLEVDQLLDRMAPATVATGSIDRVQTALSRRLYYAMIDGRKMKAHDFRHYVVEHPFVAPLARRVLFATYGKGAVLDLFRIDDHGKLVDDTGAEVEVDERVIGVVHPAEIPAASRIATLATWKKVFAKAKHEPLFEQLDRPVYELKDGEGGEDITRFKLRRAEFDRMRRVLEYERDWYVNEQHDQGGTSEWAKQFLRDNVIVVAPVGDYGSTIESLHAQKIKGTAVEFKKLHAVTVSEILYDVDTATTKPAPAPAAKKKTATTSKGAASALSKATRIEAEDGGAVDLPSVDSEEDARSNTSGIEKGTRVRVAKGYEARLKCGVVFWIGEKNGTMRAGMRADDGKTHWLDLDNLVPAGADDKVPAAYQEEPAGAAEDEEDNGRIEKGMKVSWDNGRHKGTGFVFWLGENKFGTGTRAGVKDDETGDTVWVDVKQCEPLAE